MLCPHVPPRRHTVGMEVHLRHNPSFAVARLYLAPNEPVKVEGGAMMAHSPGVQLQAKADGGIMAGLKRSVLSGESFFVTTYTAPPQGGWVDIAATLPGDLMPLQISPDRPFFVTKGSWLANSHGTEVTSKWGGMQNMFGGEGGFGLQVSGQGTVVLAVYGALDVIDLQPNEPVTIDTGHVVAYDLQMRFQMRRAVQGKTLQSMTSGEGFVFDFLGPGRVFLQSRNPSALAAYIRSLVPTNNGGGVSLF